MSSINKINVNGYLYDVCDDFARSQIQNLKNNSESNNSYYTAFEVMPNKVVITAGTLDEVTELTYSNDIPACTEHKLTLRSVQLPNECDVVIDWGDGTIEAIKEGAYVSNSAGKAYELAHDYASKMTEDVQRFIVKIYGKNYYTFRHNSYIDNNLMCRVMTKDLPIASHITSLASLCYGAKRLLKVSLDHSTDVYSKASNWASVFSDCQNLVSCMGFENNIIRVNAPVTGIFNNDTSLVETDFRVPAAIDALHTVFCNCPLLEKDINDIFPIGGFLSTQVRLTTPFVGAKKITGIVPDKLLWNSEHTKFDFKVPPFGSCSDEIKSQVPVSWGGTASDDIIEKSDKEKIAELTSRLEALENYIQNNPIVNTSNQQLEF